MSIELPIVNGKISTKALTYSNYSTPATFETIEIPTTVAPTELLVKVEAASINPVDCILKNLSYTYLGSKKKVLGGDFSGVVIKAGESLEYKEGDEIYGDILSPMKSVGSFSEYVLFDASKATVLHKIPKGMSFSQAAALPIASATGFQCLNQYAGDLEGKNVLILGAGTSVGVNTIQFAKNHFKAANVVVTCSASSASKAKSLGADLIIDYTKGESAKVASTLEFVKENGLFDVIVDCVRDNSFFDITDAVLKNQKDNGAFVRVSGSKVFDYKNPKLIELLPSFRTLKYSFGAKFGHHAKFVEVLLRRDDNYGKVVEKLWNEKKFDIIIDTEYDALTQHKEAFDKVASGKAKGKVVCTF